MFGSGGPCDEDKDAGGFAGLFGAIVMIVVAPIAAVLIQLAISRTGEYDADATGARILGDLLPLADASEKLEAANRVLPMPVDPALAHQFIVQPFSSDRFLTLFNTHPPISE